MKRERKRGGCLQNAISSLRERSHGTSREVPPTLLPSKRRLPRTFQARRNSFVFAQADEAALDETHPDHDAARCDHPESLESRVKPLNFVVPPRSTEARERQRPGARCSTPRSSSGPTPPPVLTRPDAEMHPPATHAMVFPHSQLGGTMRPHPPGTTSGAISSLFGTNPRHSRGDTNPRARHHC